jgi:hypothetical protein
VRRAHAGSDVEGDDRERAIRLEGDFDRARGGSGESGSENQEGDEAESFHREAPVITVQTSGLDFVNDIEDFQKVCTLIESRLNGEIQLSLDPKTIVREKESHAPIV